MALLDEKPAYHDPVIEVLGQLGTKAKAALPRLERIIETSDSWRTIDLAEEAIRHIRER